MPGSGHLDPVVFVRGRELLAPYGVSLKLQLCIATRVGFSNHLVVGKEGDKKTSDLGSGCILGSPLISQSQLVRWPSG